jgi:hypothetical protein
MDARGGASHGIAGRRESEEVSRELVRHRADSRLGLRLGDVHNPGEGRCEPGHAGGPARARLAGLGFDVIGIGLQVVALHYGALALVQPLLVSGLIFALILRHVGSSSRISARELLWGGALVACPTGFLFFSGATTGGSGSETADPSLLLPEA